MRFQVPQFIEVEDKIVGPFTIKQFIYMAGGGGLAFLVYLISPNFIVAFIPIALILGFSAALAFYKLNNKPFAVILEAAIKYFLGSKLYIWKKEDKVIPTSTEASSKEAKNYASLMVPKISDSKLKDLSWSLDIKESIYSDRKQR